MSNVSKYAVLDGDGTVVNVCLWDGLTEWQPSGDAVALDEGSPVGPGWARVDGEWVAPPPPTFD